jgi:hypothetical protein
MRIHDIINEDGEATSTLSNSVASVAFPLFGDQKMIRRAVDPNGYLSGKKKKKKVAEKLDKSYSAAMPSLMDIGDNAKDLNAWSKAVAGHDGKKQTSPKDSSSGTFKDHGYAVGYTKVERDMASKAIGKKTKHMTSSSSAEPSDTNKTSPVTKIKEAPELFSDNVIYRLDPENPMDDSEILVIGGAGRYSFKGLRAKARKEAAQLAQDLQSDHGQSFRGGAYNINQLANTLKTIVAAYDQLNKIRSKGGTKARGIRNEDKALIDECMNIAEQWTTKFKSKVTQ